MTLSCKRCGITSQITCPGFGKHAPAISVINYQNRPRCNLCGTVFTSVTCQCGYVTNYPQSPIVNNETASKEKPQPYANIKNVKKKNESFSDSGEMDNINNLQRSPNGEDFPMLFKELLNVYNKEIANGKISETRKQSLDSILSQLDSMMQNEDNDIAGLTASRSRLTELMASMSHMIEDPSHGTPPLERDSRADAVWKRFSKLKLYLSQDVMRPHSGSEERATGMELFKQCAYADTFLHQHSGDDDTVFGYETDTMRQLAREVRVFSLRNHLTLVSPIWASSPSMNDPNAIFFSGGDALRNLLADVCARQKLKLLGLSASKNIASARWDQLQICQVAVFDFTGYERPDPDRQIDLAGAGVIAAVAYELGIALTLGRMIIIIANEGQNLPFDVDIEPVRLNGDDGDSTLLADAIDDAIYGLQRSGTESSIVATRAYLNEKFSNIQNFIVKQSLKLIDDEVARDPIKFRQFLEPVLGGAGQDAPQIVFPAWPGSYPDPEMRRCFHVTAFGPAWAKDTMNIVSSGCEIAGVEYIRGDKVLDPNIIRSIWDNLCQASHVVVDLTGLNANVMLELGIAHALGRNVLLVTQDSDIKSYFSSITKLRMHTYSITSDSGLKPLNDALNKFFSQV
ncbi:Nucleoside 2-deoxyribosyltransferase [uncultured archaeon]|nr:Nucleoside 2-deoxyribosyltransferase [uncultured archaeon]